MLVSNLLKRQPQVPSQSTVRSFTECNDVVPFQNLASNEQRLSAHTTKDPVELVKLEFATHGLFETESTPLTVAIHMQIPAFEIVKANYSHFRTTAYKASCQALFHLPAFTLAGVSTMRSEAGRFWVVLICSPQMPRRSASTASICSSVVSLKIFSAITVMLAP